MKRLKNKRVLLLSPQSQIRNTFLSTLLDEYGDRFIYCRLTNQVQSWQELAAYLLDDLKALLDGFESTSRKKIKTSAAAAGAALAKDLSTYLTDTSRANLQYILVIDEVDRVDQDQDFADYISNLIDGLPANLKIGFNGRRLTLEPFSKYIQTDDVVVWGTEHRSSDLVFEKQAEGDLRPQLEVYAFGSGQAFVNGRPIEQWDGLLPRLLFYYFVDMSRVTRSDIFAQFWSTISRKEATNVFHVTKRKITECISDCVLGMENYELTQYESGFYVPSQKLIRHYDVAEFEDAILQAKNATDDEAAATALTHATALYRFPFLKDYDHPWIIERREALRLMYADALIDLGRWHQQREEYATALGYYIHALGEMPQREDVYRDAMRMYWKMGRRDDAIGLYELLTQHLKKTVGVAPSRDSSNLLDKIVADV